MVEQSVIDVEENAIIKMSKPKLYHAFSDIKALLFDLDGTIIDLTQKFPDRGGFIWTWRLMEENAGLYKDPNYKKRYSSWWKLSDSKSKRKLTLDEELNLEEAQQYLDKSWIEKDLEQVTNGFYPVPYRKNFQKTLLEIRKLNSNLLFGIISSAPQLHVNKIVRENNFHFGLGCDIATDTNGKMTGQFRNVKLYGKEESCEKFCNFCSENFYFINREEIMMHGDGLPDTKVNARLFVAMKLFKGIYGEVAKVAQIVIPDGDWGKHPYLNYLKKENKYN